METQFDINREYLKTLLTADETATLGHEELKKAEEALIAYAHLNAVIPSADLRNKIIGRLNKLEHEKQTRSALTLSDLPLLDEHSNWLDWQSAVEPILPPASYENIYLHPLESNDSRDLFIVWVKEFVPDEVHHDLIESFLILEGSCECYITNEEGVSHQVRLGEGEFISMKIGETHHIKITSGKPAKAILQWKKLAA